VSARPVVVVTRRLPEAVHQAASRDYDARLNPDDRPLSADGLQQAMREADALLPTVTDRITADILSTEPRRVKLIANFGVGFNNIDVEAAKASGTCGAASGPAGVPPTCWAPT
jgi:lactate dehydrogenase-like 2-hydroxyacid dehydrogenase